MSKWNAKRREPKKISEGKIHDKKIIKIRECKGRNETRIRRV